MTPVFNLENLWQILSFLGIQYSLGRRGSYPYGLLLEFSLLKITVLVIVSDMVQTVLLLNLLVYIRKKCKWLKSKKQEERREKKKRRFKEWLKTHGSAGLIVIAALPYGGGALTGSIVAVSIKMRKYKAFVLITIGCIIGSFIYYLGFAGILSFFNK